DALELRVHRGAVTLVAAELVPEEGVAELEETVQLAEAVVVLVDVFLEELDVLAVFPLLGGFQELLAELPVRELERSRHRDSERVAAGRRAVRPGNRGVRSGGQKTGEEPEEGDAREKCCGAHRSGPLAPGEPTGDEALRHAGGEAAEDGAAL